MFAEQLTLDGLTPEYLDGVAYNILHSRIQNISEFHALAQQVGLCRDPYFIIAPVGRQWR